MMRSLLIAVMLMAAAVASAADAQLMGDCINVKSFGEHVIDAGGEAEDWQPAFQAAIARARQTQQPIYVPTGEYKIRRAIEIVPVEVQGTPFVRNNIRLFGDGRYKSIISQKVDTENCINWTGLTYEKPAVHGHISDLMLAGGKIALNIKWHNNFTMDSCYIHGAAQYGVYAEGWSSRFVNSTIRWCRQAGIRGGGHLNNVIIRDCYFSRDGIGVWLLNGIHGSRIEGCGFEKCSKAAVYLRGVMSFTISNSYFEGNACKDVADRHKEAILPVEGWANTIHLDYSCWQVAIHDNILRANLDDEGAAISISDCRNCQIYSNAFYNQTNNAVKLRGRCETNPQAQTVISRLVVENNLARNVNNLLVEDQPGLIADAIARGSSFDWAPGDSTPTGSAGAD